MIKLDKYTLEKIKAGRARWAGVSKKKRKAQMTKLSKLATLKRGLKLKEVKVKE